MAKRRPLALVVSALCATICWAQDCDRSDAGRQGDPVPPYGSTGSETPTPDAGAPLGDALQADLLHGWETGPLAVPPAQPDPGPDGAGEVHASATEEEGDAQGWEEWVDTTVRRVKKEVVRWQKLPLKWWTRVTNPKKLGEWAKEKALSWIDAILPGSDD